MVFQPESLKDLQAIVKQASMVKPRGAGTKPALSAPVEGVETIEMLGLTGILEYHPEEYTFTALAGTPLQLVSRMLDEHGQYIPFDPPFIRKGATLGGTVAAGLSGPGRYHYGGVRDFLLGVQFVDGRGVLVQGGGKVVKNAAGFDLPKLMVGSLGMFGIMVEMTFKIFPRPVEYLTKRFKYPNLEQAIQGMQAASTSRVDLDALDLEPEQDGYCLWVRLGGPPNSLALRREQLERVLGDGETLLAEGENAVWDYAREFEWVPADWSLLKIPLTPGRIIQLDPALDALGCLRRYSSGGQVAWVALQADPESLKGLLDELDLNGLVLRGSTRKPVLGEIKGGAFHRLVKSVLDPDNRFVEG